MTLAAGVRVGPYEVLAPIGAGGMGEVWRARDDRLGREVALKLLPAELAFDSDRLRRFEQEARATAALSHANILAIHAVGSHEGVPYLVEELLEGETLAGRIHAGDRIVGRAVGEKLGVVRVGPLTGEEPHLLFGRTTGWIGVSPDRRFIAGSVDDPALRLWPMPDLSKPPLHTLPRAELLAKLRSLTNLRAVRDPNSDTGWKVEVGPFPGWANVPEW